MLTLIGADRQHGATDRGEPRTGHGAKMACGCSEIASRCAEGVAGWRANDSLQVPSFGGGVGIDANNGLVLCCVDLSLMLCQGMSFLTILMVIFGTR